MRRRAVASFVAAMIAVAGGTSACVDDVDVTVTLIEPATTNNTAATSDATTVPSASSSVPPEPISTATVIEDLQDFWTENLPGVFGEDYQMVRADRIVAMESDDDTIPCDGDRVRYRDVEDNAFVAPCKEGITVVYDAAGLIPSLEEQYGSAAPAVVLAHEWGHVAQFAGNAPLEKLPAYVIEQQADCFAGAWVRDAGARLGGVFADPSSLDGLIGALLNFRDQPGDDVNDVAAHGSGFDRVRAFQDGFESGKSPCADYLTSFPETTQIPFTTAEDFANQGNLDFDEMLQLTTLDLNYFFTRFLDGFTEIPAPIALGRAGLSSTTCNGSTITSADIVVRYCRAEGVVAYNDDLLFELHSEIGDNATGTLLGLAWAEAARELAGENPDSGDEPTVLRQQACLTGGWYESIITNTDRERAFSLSPGDLDEAINLFVRFGSAGSLAQPGEVFATVTALRQGVTRGAGTCGLT